MKVRVTANGEVHGTTVVDAETGKPVEEVRSVQFQQRAGDIPRVSLEINSAEMTIEGRPAFLVGDPHTGGLKRVKRIEFADGTVLDF